jgi:hypothetical protein
LRGIPVVLGFKAFQKREARCRATPAPDAVVAIPLTSRIHHFYYQCITS